MGSTNDQLIKSNLIKGNYLISVENLNKTLPPEKQEEIRDRLVGDIYREAGIIAGECIISSGKESPWKNVLMISSLPDGWVSPSCYCCWASSSG